LWNKENFPVGLSKKKVALSSFELRVTGNKSN